MSNIDDIENPEEELRRLNKAISQYSVVFRTSNSAAQKDRVEAKLKSLMEFRETLLQVFDISDEGEPPAEIDSETMEGLKYLSQILRDGQTESIEDREMNKLSLYLNFFDREFMRIFSERQMKLDFQHSLERDGFYHRFQEITRKLSDLDQELQRLTSEDLRFQEKSDLKKRIARMKRVLSIESHKFYHSVAHFAADLIDDLQGEGLKCLNGEDTIQFDDIEGKRYLEGVSVGEALTRVREFSLEFLNVPDFEAMEQ